MATLAEIVHTTNQELRKCTHFLIKCQAWNRIKDEPGPYMRPIFNDKLLVELFGRMLDLGFAAVQKTTTVPNKDDPDEPTDTTLVAFKGKEEWLEELYRHVLELNHIFTSKRRPFGYFQTDVKHVKKEDRYEFDEWMKWLGADKSRKDAKFSEIEWRCMNMVDALEKLHS